MFRRSTCLMKKHVENWKVVTQANNTNTPVVRNARQVLIQLYRKILEDVKQAPVTSAYRQNVEGVTKWRLAVCEATHSHKEIEMAMEAGIVEEIIDQAKMELELVPFVINRRPWEVPLDWTPPKLTVDGYEFDWMKLRQDRVEKSFKLRSEMSEQDRAQFMNTMLKRSNPDYEIYPKEMADYIARTGFCDLKTYKGVRFGI
eukprot:CAMPEP_0197077086 /NCGR_PEP_ID=MMETSP1384-20130603/212440_1 /TAXON_ID=29189 /ORGANISM="Ammonia sp." /LENGTH=200 /DNA_ID=CAMNT_0042515945 /DNA_START=24 /DNA_END=626 /DNA_ORIENTATION=+